MKLPPVTDLNASPDNLVPFFDLVAFNQKVSIAKYPEQYELLRRVNVCLSTAGKHLANANPMMCGVLYHRCQYAYKAAAGMSLSGQAVEVFVMARSCLEYAGYALTIFNKPDLQAIFAGRHVSAADMHAQKEAFLISKIKNAIESFDPHLARIFNELYQRSIDFGGHPNPHGTFSAMNIEDNGPPFVSMTAFVTDAPILQHAMKSVAQIGLAALFIFQHVFKAKFELLGINAEMNKLRREKL
jgi:hypothetical protein